MGRRKSRQWQCDGRGYFLLEILWSSHLLYPDTRHQPERCSTPWSPFDKRLWPFFLQLNATGQKSAAVQKWSHCVDFAIDLLGSQTRLTICGTIVNKKCFCQDFVRNPFFSIFPKKQIVLRFINLPHYCRENDWCSVVKLNPSFLSWRMLMCFWARRLLWAACQSAYECVHVYWCDPVNV